MSKLRHADHRGVSLLTVMVILLLSTIAVMGSFRVARLAEAMQRNGSDYERAFAAAEALLRDAEIDIRGRRPPYETLNADGQPGNPCLPLGADVIGCRRQTGQQPWFPQNSFDFDEVSDLVQTAAGNSNGIRCSQGICVPQQITEFANLGQLLPQMQPLGACYGQFTRQGQTATAGVGDSNPLLAAQFDQNTGARAWYWVELFKYTTHVGAGPGAANVVTPEPSRNFIYRITAVAQGLREGTQVVLHSLFIPFPAQAAN